MADQREAGISWTDETWNPVVGCSIVSPACTNCYAMGMAARIERMSGGNTHYTGTTKTVNGKPVWTGKLAMAPDQILTAPLRWKRPRRVFVNSMSDLFHDDMPDEWIDRVFAVMALSPRHTFQVLTKRPDRMRRYVSDPATIQRVYAMACDIALALNLDRVLIARREHEAHAPPGERVFLGVWPLANVWFGVTAEDQERANQRVPHLLATPAAIRFVSAEPLLGPIDFRQVRIPAEPHSQIHDALSGYSSDTPFGLIKASLPDRFGRGRLDWIIVGGESGTGARPTHPDWARSIRDQCAAAGVAFHFKQWGEWAPGECSDGPPTRTEQTSNWWNGHWQMGTITVRDSEEMHRDDEPDLYRLGKRRSGRTLDGKIHDAFPEAPQPDFYRRMRS